MWNWKFLLSVAILYAITLSDFPDLLNNWRKFESEGNFKCKNKLGDGSVMCYFTDHIRTDDIFSVNKITPEDHFYIDEIFETCILKIHSLNMPENLPGMCVGVLLVINSRDNILKSIFFKVVLVLFSII